MKGLDQWPRKCTLVHWRQRSITKLFSSLGWSMSSFADCLQVRWFSQTKCCVVVLVAQKHGYRQLSHHPVVINSSLATTWLQDPFRPVLTKLLSVLVTLGSSGPSWWWEATNAHLQHFSTWKTPGGCSWRTDTGRQRQRQNRAVILMTGTGRVNTAIDDSTDDRYRKSEHSNKE